jgi:NAD(P)-dependent dehydrogenase (short-subunit alcohol dehydrogenase family)
VAETFAAEGARVALNARKTEELDRAVAEIRQAGGDALAVRADVTDARDVERMVGEVVARFETIHVLVNNAGGVGSFARFEDLSDDDWLSVIDLNLFSTVRVTRAVLPHMRRQKWGRIINISSESGQQPDPEMANYNASKAAIINLTKSLSKAYASEGILVNVVSPAFIMTPLVAGMMEAQGKAAGIPREEAVARFLAGHRPHIELRRPGRSEEVAAAVAFLASEAASFINGANLRVDGGSVASL